MDLNGGTYYGEVTLNIFMLYQRQRNSIKDDFLKSMCAPYDGLEPCGVQDAGLGSSSNKDKEL